MKPAALLGVLAALAVSACGTAGNADQGEAAGLPDVARVICDPDGTRVEPATVKPQRDGVHLELVNETGEDFWIPRTNTGVLVGTSTRIVDLPPGKHEISCYPVDMEPEPVDPESAHLEVVDEDGIWASDRLDCREVGVQYSDEPASARGTTSDPLEAARQAVEGYGVEPDDAFEPVGYPEGDSTRIRLLREGETLAVVELTDDSTGKWLATMATVCPSLQN